MASHSEKIAQAEAWIEKANGMCPEATFTLDYTTLTVKLEVEGARAYELPHSLIEAQSDPGWFLGETALKAMKNPD